LFYGFNFSIFYLDLALKGAYFLLVVLPPPLPPWLSYFTGAAGFES